MDGTGCWVLFFLVCGVVGFLFWHFTGKRADAEDESRRRERAERDAKRARVEEEELVRKRTEHWLQLKDCFPYLPTPRAASESSADIGAAILTVLYSAESYGKQGAERLPIPAIPQEERKRHLWVVGKSGTGKSTFLEHLIVEDAKKGLGLAVIGPEGEFFRDRLLNLIPRVRADNVVYFAPGNPRSTITLNPLSVEAGDDPIQSADELFSIFTSVLDKDVLGPRMRPLLQNALAALMGQEGATLTDISRICTDAEYRKSVLRTADPYVRGFWEQTFPQYPRNAALPLVYRLDRFLRTPTLRRVFGNPAPGLSIRACFRDRRILLVDLFGITEEEQNLLGQVMLSKIQREVMRRERGEAQVNPVHLYCDEFQSFAGVSETLWRSLLSRGRKYGLSVTLANQYPGQLPPVLRSEILGNVNSLACFQLGSGDAGSIRNELLTRETTMGKDGSTLTPVPTVELMDLPVGMAVLKLAGGKAVIGRLNPPLSILSEDANDVMVKSWERYGAPPARPGSGRPGPIPKEPEPQEHQRPQSEQPEAQPAPEPEVKLGPEAEPEPQQQKESARPEASQPEPKQAKRKAPPQERGTTQTGSPSPRKPSEPTRSEPELSSGRGGTQHRYLANLISSWAKSRGYRAKLEEPLPTGGFVDVLLEKDEKRTGIEIAVSSNAKHEVQNVEKCLRADLDQVIVTSSRKRLLTEIKKRLPKPASGVLLLLPEELIEWIGEQGGGAAPPSPYEDQVIAGYTVTVSPGNSNPAADQARRRAIGDILKKRERQH